MTAEISSQVYQFALGAEKSAFELLTRLRGLEQAERDALIPSSLESLHVAIYRTTQMQMDARSLITALESTTALKPDGASNS